LAGERVGMVSEWVQNIRSLRILSWTKAYEDRIIRKRIEETKNRLSMVMNGQFMSSMAASVNFLINVAAVGALVHFREAQARVLTAGDLLALLWVVGVFLSKPLRSLPWFFTFGFDATSSMRRLESFLKLENRKPKIRSLISPSSNSNAIEIKNLNLFIGDKHLLKNINFQLKPGSLVAIVGELGCGKTLLLQSLMGETGAQFEEYHLLGKNVAHLKSEELRNLFSLVPQEGFVMSATLSDNIAFDYDIPIHEKAPKEGIDLLNQCLTLSHLDHETPPLHFSTLIGERGVNLSGGQKQRVGLARASYFNRPIILMDDSLSAVDFETEKQLMHSLLFERWKDRVRILVTHRLTVLPHVHQILFLENGALTEMGTYSELLKKSETFARFASSMIRESQPLSTANSPGEQPGEPQ
jgi:ATP-binding cassette, subfamily B, multidrug efflux pump